MVLLAAILATLQVQEWTNVSWERRPDEAQPPHVASVMGLRGLITLVCRVDQDGPPTNCRVAEAVPEGAGFEAAALAIAPTGRLKARTIDGQVVPGTVRFQVRFNVEPLVQLADEEWPVPERLDQARKVIDTVATKVGQKSATGLLSEVFGEAMPAPDRAIVDVGEDRAEQVRLWMEQLGLSDVDPGLSTLAEAVADHFTPEEMASIDNVEDFRRVLVTAARRSNGDISSLQYRRSVAELRRRYCESYDCRQPGDESRSTN